MIIEGDTFRQVIPINENEILRQDTHQDKFAKVIEFCSAPKTKGEIMDFLGLKDKVNFRNNIIITHQIYLPSMLTN